jgi:hypothetical protein
LTAKTIVLTVATSLGNTAKGRKPVENSQKPSNTAFYPDALTIAQPCKAGSSVRLNEKSRRDGRKRRGRGIVVERRPQKDEAPSGAADWEDVAPDGA